MENKKMILQGIGNCCFIYLWADYAKGEQLIIQPKFNGCKIALLYQSGTLVAAFSRSGKDVLEAARHICNIPLELPEDGMAVSEEPV